MKISIYQIEKYDDIVKRQKYKLFRLSLNKFDDIKMLCDSAVKRPGNK